MDIASLSMHMANIQVKSQASLAVMGNIKDAAEQQGEQLIKMLEGSAPPHPDLGTVIDLRM